MQTNTKPPGYSNRNPNLSYMPWAVKKSSQTRNIKNQRFKN